jgi:threonine aldolase
LIKKARRIRKVMGGGMRQAGFLAAAGLYALENNIDRLQQDHLHAAQLQEVLSKKEFVGVIMPVETNILIFEVSGSYTPLSFRDYLLQHDIDCMPISPTQVRMVTHLDITPAMMVKTLEIIAAM